MNQNSLLFLTLNILARRHTSEVIITVEILSQFEEYNVMFHFEDEDKFKVDLIRANLKYDTSYLMNNYNETFKHNFVTRPLGYKFLHVVLLKNYTNIQTYTNSNPFSLRYVDIVLFVINEEKNFSFWEGNILHKAGGLFILNTWNLSLYSICFYCGKMTKIFRKINGLKINDNYIEIPDLTIYKNQFLNFNKHVFAIGYNIYKPLYFGTGIENTENHTIYEGMGIERELLVILSEKLNFICLMVPFMTYKNSWAAVVNAVSRNELDFAISGITLTLPRTKIVDFSARIRTEPYSVLYCLYEDPWMSWKYILMPFDIYVWLTIAGTLLVLTFMLYKSTDEISIVFFIQGWLRLLFEQPLPRVNNALKNKWTTIFFMFLFFMSALLINYSYKSKLTASLIHSKATEYDTVDELVDKGYSFQMNDFDSTVLQQNLKLSADPKFLEILKKSNNETEYCTGIRKTVKHKTAMIDEITLMQNIVHEKCRPSMPVIDQDQMRLLRDDIFPSTHAWPMQLNTPYRMRFNNVISRIQAAGLFVKWVGDFAPPSQIVPRSHQRHTRLEAPSVNLASMLGPAIIWTVGVCLATLVFIGELLHPRCKSHATGRR